jgi:methionyl-tRNA formyltransferase
MRILFYGTPDFAVPTLEALCTQYQVIGVVTQPDRPAGRGQRPRESAVKTVARQRGLPIAQPARLRDPEWPGRLGELLPGGCPDVAVVVAYGQILPQPILDLPTRGSINVHASLLPRYRGAAPIAWAIIRGERETGITTFRMDAGMDTGPILLQRVTPIGAEETAGELAGRLAVLGATLAVETLARLDELTPMAQDGGAATDAPRLRKADGPLDWTRPAVELAARVRGLNPWPGATTARSGAAPGRLTIWRARPVDGTGAPGILTAHPAGLAVGAGQGLLLPLEVQPENRRAMTWEAYLRGARLEPGAILGAADARR